MTEVVNREVVNKDCNQALQTALELSMLNICSNNASSTSYGLFDDFDANAKSQNITQCVAVPSSEHVAEIVGRQGEEIWC